MMHIRNISSFFTTALLFFSTVGDIHVTAIEQPNDADITTTTTTTSKVIELNDATFENLTQASTGQTTGKWFVKFYAPWCGHCKKLNPIWDELADQLSTFHEESSIIIAKVDCTENQQLLHRFEISGFPTLKYFADGGMYTYAGPRTVPALMDFVLTDYINDNVKQETVPSPPPAWVTVITQLRAKLSSYKTAKYLIEDFEHIVTYRKNAAFVIFTFGAWFGLIIAILVSMLANKKAVRKAAKSHVKKD